MLNKLAKRFRDRLIRHRLPRVVPKIRRTLPHDESAFTQGLKFHQAKLYESTGLEPGSSLRRIDPNDGKIEEMVAVDNDFAEGIAVFRNELYQLSWKRGVVRVYGLSSLELTRTIAYAGEGWGLAAHEGGFYMSNGSSKIQLRDANFQLTREFRVRAGLIPIHYLNDLEFANGRLYANVLWRNEIFEINPVTGRVLRLIDCEELSESVGSPDMDSVLNGIAYDAHEERFFVTGKRWRSIFEISIPPRAILKRNT